MDEKRYIIGIDLGTTNSAVSYVDLHAENTRKRGIRLFKIPQLTGPGEVSALPVLPSFSYLPGAYDISDAAIQLPWKHDDPGFVGRFARDHGSRVPSRLVASAKSWLCHSGADRRAPILPWGSGDDVRKISPVQATALYLNHIRLAWNSQHGDDDALYLENQTLIITVPASFDEVARDLTVEAAAMGGLKNVTLLEEPLAAFYSWLIAHEADWQDHIRPGELVLVCDVGGGTTDFTLITLDETEGAPRFVRIAVGDHLILGGDNIDLALARHVEKDVSGQAPLAGDRWKTLCHLCRQAKENILNSDIPGDTVTMMGTGTRLIGGTLSTEIRRESLEKIVLDGFFPVVKPDSGVIQSGIRKGISEFGLPYATEPAITRHIGIFLEKHREEVHNLLQKPPLPDFILFNGGSLKAAVVQERIREAIRAWFSESDERLPRILENPDPDLAVALGAGYYGLVKAGQGVRVGSGSARAYYLGLAGTVKGGANQAICLVERGAEEGERISLPDRVFDVLTNQPVHFTLYSSSFRSGDKSGDLISVDDTLTPLPPVQTVIQFGQKGVKTAIPVQIEAEYTEMGILAIWCRSLSSPHRWRLQFQLRNADADAGVRDAEVFEADVVNKAVSLIEQAFSERADGTSLNRIVKSVSGVVGRSREKWPLSLLRSMADQLLKMISSRRHSPEHEIRWMNLTGYCLRPGFGDGLDEQRIRQLWKIYKQGVLFGKNPQASQEWWILWRRVAGGLSSGQQRQFIQDARSRIIPRKGTKVRIRPQEQYEIWMAVANMERLGVRDKIEFGRQLLETIQPRKIIPQLIWSLSRIGGRDLLYGPVDRVVPPSEAAAWAERLMGMEPRNPVPVGSALVQMARKTGDRARDMDAQTIDRVSAWLEQHQMTDKIKFLTMVVPMERQDETLMFGEELPSGIILRERSPWHA
jgi:molecular chaperone DnaK (HSP70)